MGECMACLGGYLMPRDRCRTPPKHTCTAPLPVACSTTVAPFRCLGWAAGGVQRLGRGMVSALPLSLRMLGLWGRHGVGRS